MNSSEERIGLFATGANMLLPGDVSEIPIQAAISQFEPADYENLPVVEAKTRTSFRGIIDTGASATCLSHNLAK